MQIRKTILSTALAFALVSTFTACGGSSVPGTKTPVPGQTNPDTGKTDPLPDTTKPISVLSGSIDTGEQIDLQAKSQRAAITLLNENLNCGTSADVQLYDISDVDYETPLLKDSLQVDIATCTYDVTSDKFTDKTKAGIDKQYIIRTIIQQKDGKKLELSAAKLQEGKKAPKVDPIATILKAKFDEMLKDTKEDMQKLTDLGVNPAIIDSTIAAIVESFKENFDDTLAALREDVKEGKIEIKTEDFETTAEIDQKPTEEVKLKRKTKKEAFRQKVQNSSAEASFQASENILKRARTKEISRGLTLKQLKGKISEPIAQMKYGIIENFVKMGLPVHDGNGNIIVFLPTDSKDKGKLPGKIFTLKYYGADGKKAGTIGDDFAIRVLNPESDLARVDGSEDWFRNFNLDSPKIPNSVIDQFILKRDYTTTVQDLGLLLDGIVGGNNGLKALYGKKLSSNIKKSSEVILEAYKRKLLKNSYDRAFFDRLDRVFSSNLGMADKILELPFIARANETKEQFITRITKNPKIMGYIRNKLGTSLVNGIPASDDDANVLQFKDGFTISRDTKIKPLTSLTLVNLFMEANGGNSDSIFKEVALNDEFDWMKNLGNKFDNKSIWMLRWNDLQTNANDGSNDMSLDDRAEEDKIIVLKIIKAITGVKEIKIERSFDEMVKNLNSMMKKIDEKMQAKMQEESYNAFEQEFQDDIVVFNPDQNVTTTVEFAIHDARTNPITGLNLSLVPVFENIKTYERIPMEHLAVEVSPDGEKYGVNDIDIINPDLIVDKDGLEQTDGKYRATFEYELIIVENGQRKPIAYLSIFPGINKLGFPFIYDDSVNYGYADTYEPGMQPNEPQNFAEHDYIDFSQDKEIFFPFVTKNNGEMVGENILKFDSATNTLSMADKRGVLSDANISISILTPQYDYKGLPASATSLIFDKNIFEGALVTLKLSGDQIKNQVISFEITFLDDEGAEIKLYRDGGTSGYNPAEDRFNREGAFTVTEGKKGELTFNDDATIGFDGKTYSYISEDFDSITMQNIYNNDEYVTFRFVKEEFKKSSVSISGSDIEGKELLFVDEYMAIKIVFNADGTYQRTSKDRFGGYGFDENGNWSIDNDAIKLNSYENLVITRSEDDMIGVGDKIIFADFYNGVVNPMSPEHKILYLGTPRGDKASFNDLVQSRDFFTTPVDSNAPEILEPVVTGDDLFEIFSDQTFFLAITEDDAYQKVERVEFNADISKVTFTNLGNNESEIYDLEAGESGFFINGQDGIVEVIAQDSDFITLQIIEHDRISEVLKFYFDEAKARENYDSIVYENPFNMDSNDGDSNNQGDYPGGDQGGFPPVDPNAPAILGATVTGDDLRTLLADKSFYYGNYEDNNFRVLEEISFNYVVNMITLNTIEGDNTEDGNKSVALENDGFKIESEEGFEFIKIIATDSVSITIQKTINSPDGSFSMLDRIEKLYFTSGSASENYDSVIYERPYEDNNGGGNHNTPPPVIQDAVATGDNLMIMLANQSFYYADDDNGLYLEKSTFNNDVDLITNIELEGNGDLDRNVSIILENDGFKIESEEGFEFIKIIAVDSDSITIQKTINSYDGSFSILDQVMKLYFNEQDARDNLDSFIYESPKYSDDYL